MCKPVPDYIIDRTGSWERSQRLKKRVIIVCAVSFVIVASLALTLEVAS